MALCRLLPDSRGKASGERRVRISRMGGWPKKRLYSRLNWLALSYPTSNAALAASTPSMSMRSRADGHFELEHEAKIGHPLTRLDHVADDW